MTRNQIEYWKLKEQQRSNKASQAEQSRSNKAQEQETVRSNRARESETHRSNLINESHQSNVLGETIRANKARESHNVATLQETKRSNVAREAETRRSNLANERETNRSNVARETETMRSNLANESISRDRNTINREHYERMDSETNRHNLVTEGIQTESLGISRDTNVLGYSRLASDEYRTNVQASAQRYAADTNANLGYANLAEVNRANLQNEWIRTLSEAEKARSNRAAEKNAEQRNVVSMFGEQTKRFSQELEAEKWRTAGYSNTLASTALTSQRAATESTLRQPTKDKLQAETASTWAKTFSNVVNNVTKLIGGAANGKK